MSNQSDNNATNDVAINKPVSTAPHVYVAINAVQAELAYMGITKDRSTTGKGSYKFRGIDDIYNALSPIMVKHNLIVSPRYEDRITTDRVGSGGYSLFFTTLTGHFDFISAIDGSKHTVTTYGEAMDSGDKGTNKAMSIAQKYAFFQLFVIPTQSSPDPDDYVQPQDKYTQQASPMRDVHSNQQDNYLPSLPAPIDAIACQINGKNYTDGFLRIFNADEFKTVLQSIHNNQFPAERFLDDSKYFYSPQQINALQKLSATK